MTYVNIAAELVAILNTITEFNAVYNYEKKELEKYPCATVTALSHSDEFADTSSNQRTFRFSIRLYYRTDTEQDAETILRDLVDKVIVAIEAKPRLNNVVDFARPIDATWDYTERELPVRYCAITIECLTRLPR